MSSTKDMSCNVNVNGVLAMRTVVTDDDGAEWSIEILDGDAPIKQTPTSSGIGDELVYPPFLNDYPTKVAVSRTQSTDQQTTLRAADVRHSHSCTSSLESGEKGHPTSMIAHAKNARRVYSVPMRELAPQDNCHHERGQVHKKHKAHELVQPAREPSTSSSTQTSSSKVGKGEASLPVYSFMEYEGPPTVTYTKSESEANSLVQTLKGPLGFDLEWRVMWHSGAQERRTALVQLCDRRTILLIQVSSMKRFPRKVLEIIECPDIVKTGANILNDGEKLYRDFGIQAKGLVELGAFATRADDKFSSVYNREIVSLAKMVAMYVGRTLPKGKVRTSNWESNLSRSMVEYAANDCHCALMVYDRLQEIADRDGKTLDVSTYVRQVIPRALKLPPVSQLPLPPQFNTSTGPPVPHFCIPEPPRPQQLRAYKLWHVDKMSLNQMCMALRTGTRVEPLKESTVISYVIGALQADPRLPFHMDNLKALVHMEANSWQRHRQWISSRE